ncbi:MAG: hypothetical protein IKP75_00280 [Oscillospiraceae bacterium]|nr:hypothetical protein [Oscillospiraceae bacterium]
MRFFVDFENVGSTGLIGIESLTENDCVRIYYSNDPNVDMYTVVNMVHSAAKIQFIKLPDSLKKMNLPNALDIVLLTDISRIAASLGKAPAVVISNDKGYDPVISEISSTNKTNNILRLDSIRSMLCVKDQQNESIGVDHNALKLLFDGSLKKYAADKNKIVDIVKTSKTRCEINNRINSSFDNEGTKEIMGALKPIIKTLPGQ